MDLGRVLAALRLEAAALSRGVAGLSGAEWDLPTRCEPWSVRELLGHVVVTLGWLPDMLAAPAPDRAKVSAGEYYRPDERFAVPTNAKRIDLARDLAGGFAGGAELAGEFAGRCRRVDDLCRAEPGRRVVRTRHGDPMLLSEFLVTRVVEVALHGIDLADALGRESWLTPAAGDVVAELLLGPGRVATLEGPGWGLPQFLRKATGRESLDAAETAWVERLGIRRLTLG